MGTKQIQEDSVKWAWTGAGRTWHSQSHAAMLTAERAYRANQHLHCRVKVAGRVMVDGDEWLLLNAEASRLAIAALIKLKERPLSRSDILAAMVAARIAFKSSNYQSTFYYVLRRYFVRFDTAGYWPAHLPDPAGFERKSTQALKARPFSRRAIRSRLTLAAKTTGRMDRTAFSRLEF